MDTAIYTLGGLKIASGFPLLGLPVCPNETEAHCELVIRYASIHEEFDKTAARFFDGQYSGTYNGSEVLLESSSLGRFLVRAGREILIDLKPSANDEEASAYLLGAVFGALCHQRGIIPLHASVIDLDEVRVAFVGASGAGKSTLIAALAKRGYEVIADDECFLQLDESGDFQAWPGIRQIRLWHDAIAGLGFASSQVEKEIQGYDKYIVPLPPPRNSIQARPLSRIYQLHRSKKGGSEFIRLRGAEAVATLMQNVYPPGLAARLGYQTHVFNVCVAVALDVPVFRLSRPWDFAALDRDIDILEKHLRETH